MPDQPLLAKGLQVSVKLQASMQPAALAAAKHKRHNLINQAIAAMYAQVDG